MIPEKLEDHPPSDKLVYHLLEENGPMSQSNVSEAAFLPHSTVSKAMNRLREAGHITHKPDPRNPSRLLWVPNVE